MTDFATTAPPGTRVLRFLLEGAVVVMFVLLIASNYTLRRQVRASAIPAIQRHGFVPKDVVASIPTVGLDGRPGTLDLQAGRTIVAIVDPRCESCRELIATMRGAAEGIRVLSVAPPAETRTMAQEFGLASVTTGIGKPLPARVDAQLQIYPQLFVVDRGRVVRTCATLAECR